MYPYQQRSERGTAFVPNADKRVNAFARTPQRTAAVDCSSRPVHRPIPTDNGYLEPALASFKPAIDRVAQVDSEYITAHDAVGLRNSRNEPQMKALHGLMVMVQKKIRTALTLGLGDVMWTIPDHQIDLPVYNKRKMMRQVRKTLRENGFYVKRVGGRSTSAGGTRSEWVFSGAG